MLKTSIKIIKAVFPLWSQFHHITSTVAWQDQFSNLQGRALSSPLSFARRSRISPLMKNSIHLKVGTIIMIWLIKDLWK
jgi:hypothetical protein